MVRNFSHWVVAVAFLSLPTSLMAGGPPFLCLPVEGVTSENAQACTDLLNSKLADKFWKQSSRPHGVSLVRREDQWYLTFYMGQDVRLGDIQAALKGSVFSVPRDKLRLFGHAILEIDARSASQQALLADLKAVPYVAIEESKVQQDVLLVTLDMPYPAETGRPERESVGWKTFRRNDRSFDQSSRSEAPATPETLPSYRVLRDVVAKHDAGLKDIRWNINYACRALGAVGDPGRKTKSQPAGLTKQ